jgi:hypothetical protein
MIPAIKKLGGWNAAFDLLAERGLVVSPRNRAAWKQRGLPKEPICVLAAELADRGIPFAPDDFVKPEKVRNAA